MAKIGILHTAYVGDLILCSQTIEALYINGHQISLFTSSAGVRLYNDDIRIKKTVLVPKKNKIQCFSKITKSLRECDHILVPHRSLTSAIMVFLSRRPSIGFKGRYSFLYQKSIQVSQKTFEAERILSLVPKDWIPISPKLPYWKSPSQDKIQKRMVEVPFLKDLLEKKYFMISPGSQWPTKRYPMSQLSELVRLHLDSQKDLYCFMNTGPGEEELGQEFLKYLPEEYHSRIFHFMPGFTSFLDLFIILERSLFAISNDSALVHLAWAFQKPTLGIYGPTGTDHGFTPPGTVIGNLPSQGIKLDCQPCSFHGHKVCPRQHHRCMKDLDPKFLYDLMNHVP
jgi:heptosyltransferase-2